MTDVRDFVRQQQNIRKRVMACQVLDFLYTKGYITIAKKGGTYQPKALALALALAYRNVRKYLQKNDYRRGQRKGTIVLSNNHLVLLDLYLQDFFSNRDLPKEQRHREVYLD